MTVYDDLGVRTVLNAAGMYTRLGGSRIAPEVLEAMAAAAGSFVRIEDLQEAAGRAIAAATGAESGYVTSGAAAGLLLGTAACVAGLDVQRMERLPDTSVPGTKHEVVVHRVHRNSYDHALRAVGVRLVEVGHVGHPAPGPTRPHELERAINERTAMVFWPVMDEDPGALPLAETARIAHGRGVPGLRQCVVASRQPPPASSTTACRGPRGHAAAGSTRARRRDPAARRPGTVPAGRGPLSDQVNVPERLPCSADRGSGIRGSSRIGAQSARG